MKGKFFLLSLVISCSTVAADQQKSIDELIRDLKNLIPRSIVGPSTYGIPSGFGLSRGQGYIAGSITNHRTEDSEAASEQFDGSYAFGIGLLNPRSHLGVDATLGILSSTPGDQDEAGNFSFKLHKQLINKHGPYGVAIGANNVAPWGDPEAIKTSYYVAVSQLLTQTRTTLVKPDLMLSAGFSDGAKNGGRDTGLYFGIGAKFSETGSISGSWSGDEFVTGLSFQPQLNRPIIISTGIADLTDQNDDRRILVSVTYALTNLF